MAYCRFGTGGAYIVATGIGDKPGIVCMNCSLLPPQESFQVPAEPGEWHKAAAVMLEHAREHIEAGDPIPDYAIKRLEEEASDAVM